MNQQAHLYLIQWVGCIAYLFTSSVFDTTSFASFITMTVFWIIQDTAMISKARAQDHQKRSLQTWSRAHHCRGPLSDGLSSPHESSVGYDDWFFPPGRLTLWFTTWASLCSWSSFTVSAVSRCISWQSLNCYSCLCKFLYYTLHMLLSISSPYRLYIYCISSSDKANLSLCYHWSWFGRLQCSSSLFWLFLGHGVFCSLIHLAGLQVVPKYSLRRNSLANVTLGK